MRRSHACAMLLGCLAGNLLLLCLSTLPPLCRLVALERNATVSFLV
eukprot:SAG11_NODE_38058_length_254_cov_0.658065_1_plen_45_part_01